VAIVEGTSGALELKDGVLTDSITLKAAGKVGTAIVTAKVGARPITCRVTVQKPVETIEITTKDGKKFVVKDGETLDLVADIKPEGAATPIWTGTPSSVGAVNRSSGRVTGKLSSAEAKKFTVTATAGGQTATKEITVVPIPPEKLTLDSTKANVGRGGTLTLKATVAPSNTTYVTPTWTSKNEEIATVSKNGKVTVKSTAPVDAKVIIVASLPQNIYNDDGSLKEAKTLTAECEITVTSAPATAVNLNPADPITLAKGGKATITARLAPTTSTDTVKWEADPKDVIEVPTGLKHPQDKNIEVTALKAGETVLTANANGHTASVRVVVSGIALEKETVTVGVGSNVTVNKLLYGDARFADSTDWEWTSSDDKIARVNPTSGQITGVAIGTADVKCKNGSYEAVVKVTVSESGGKVLSQTMSTTSDSFSFASLRTQLYNQCYNTTQSPLSYITGLTVNADQGTLYYGYSGEGSTGTGVSSSDKFYYSSGSRLAGSLTPKLSLAASADDKLIERITFVPKSGFSGTADISYTAVPTSGTSYGGTLRLTVPASSSSLSLTYTSEKGEAVYFHSGDFSDRCQPSSGYPVASVRFGTPSERYGYLYYGYAGGEVYSSNVSDTRRYYNGSDPSLDNVAFVPRANYSGTFTFPYTCWDTAGNTFSGNIRITVRQGSGQAGTGDISYSAYSGQRLYFDASDFANLCTSTTGGTLRYVQFTDTSDLAGKATLYGGANGTSYLYANTICYYSGAGSYYNYLWNVNLLPNASFTGTLTLPFRALDTAGRSFEGSVVITVTKNTGSAVTIYKSTSGMPVSFTRADFTDACKGALPGTLKSVRFYLPSASTGKLYESFKDLQDNKLLSSTKDVAAADLIKVAFVPKGNYNGSAYLTYIASDQQGNTCTGTIQVAAWPAYESQYFNDMKNSTWAISSVDFLRSMGVVTGATETTYAPTRAMTRGDFVLMLARAYDLPTVGNTSFADVSKNSYYAEAIASAKHRGIATGDAANRFYPTNSITRQDASVLLYRAMQADGQKVETGSVSDLSRFTDGNQVSSYARTAMAALVNLGIFKGDTSGRLNPTATLSRAEMAAILHRAVT